MENPTKNWTRRSFLWRLLTIPPVFILAACSGRTLEEILSGMRSGSAVTQSLPPTPACDDGDNVTIAQTEGPYYTPDTPERTSFIEPDMNGTKLVVSGYVLSTDCTPIPRALLDFWHCDDAGVYDNVGYRLRGHQFTDENGRYALETILPAVYSGRTRHIHVKAQAPNQPVLTSQLYFPGEPANLTDNIYRPELEMAVQDSEDGKLATFNFVLNVT
jgi:protocatechuate 3,4-dioxygenase beta subunit